MLSSILIATPVTLRVNSSAVPLLLSQRSWVGFFTLFGGHPVYFLLRAFLTVRNVRIVSSSVDSAFIDVAWPHLRYFNCTPPHFGQSI